MDDIRVPRRLDAIFHLMEAQRQMKMAHNNLLKAHEFASTNPAIANRVKKILDGIASYEMNPFFGCRVDRSRHDPR